MFYSDRVADRQLRILCGWAGHAWETVASSPEGELKSPFPGPPPPPPPALPREFAAPLLLRACVSGEWRRGVTAAGRAFAGRIQ